ncbi:MAG: YbdD/YjiX family protein [Steroidobacteraceae bacterium]
MRSGARLRDIFTGASGLAAYEQYLAHLHAHHPGVIPMSREAFFRADLTARWEGVRRCC